MTHSLDHHFQAALDKFQAEGLYRKLPTTQAWTSDFTSNNYLSLHIPLGSPDASPSSGSRLLAGNHQHIEEAEAYFAQFLHAEKALLFNSGYTANLGFWSTVPGKSDLVLFDRKVHASIRDGIKLGKATAVGFKHNNLTDLEQKIQRLKIKHERVFVAVESVYSMDGDLAPLEKLVNLSQRWGTVLVVDEAHGAGTSFPTGKGWVVDLGLESQVDFRLVTVGKAFGLHGAFWLGSSEFCAYMINACRAFIYTTALPNSIFDVNWPLWESQFTTQLHQLHKNARSLHGLPGKLVSEHPYSPIKYLPCGSAQKALDVQGALAKQGIRAQAVRYPTVPKGEEKIRICVNANHTAKELETLVKELHL
ncbi:MAG: 8-amino-7-oxononanoate synthase [Sphingobacteriales bacterium]